MTTQVYTCPYCGEPSFKEKEFFRHVNKEHKKKLEELGKRLQRLRDR